MPYLCSQTTETMTSGKVGFPQESHAGRREYIMPGPVPGGAGKLGKLYHLLEYLTGDSDGKRGQESLLDRG